MGNVATDGFMEPAGSDRPAGQNRDPHAFEVHQQLRQAQNERAVIARHRHDVLHKLAESKRNLDESKQSLSTVKRDQEQCAASLQAANDRVSRTEAQMAELQRSLASAQHQLAEEVRNHEATRTSSRSTMQFQRLQKMTAQVALLKKNLQLSIEDMDACNAKLVKAHKGVKKVQSRVNRSILDGGGRRRRYYDDDDDVIVL